MKFNVFLLWQILPLENSMKTPKDFGGWNGVLNTSMIIVMCLYTAVGFFGYVKYGNIIEGTITSNLPGGDVYDILYYYICYSIFIST